MPQGSSARRRHPGLASRQGLEQLDQRLVCAGPALAANLSAALIEPTLRVETIMPVINQNPSVGADPSTEPAFSLRFNQPINGLSLLEQDFQLDQVAADGTMTPIALRENGLAEAIDPADSTSQSLLVSVLRPLDSGNYRLVLLGSNTLRDVAGQGAAQVDQVLNTFAVGGGTTDSPGANGLGTLASGSNSLFVPVGTGDQGSPPTRVTLTGGLTWNLSSRFEDLAADDFRISLFDAQQHLIAVVPGSSVTDLDQYLTAGTYFLQVNRVDASSAAAPVALGVTFTGTTTTDEVPVVRSVLPLNDNSESANPDSILVQFAGSGLPNSFLATSRSIYSLVDENGQRWDIDPLADDAATNQLFLAFPGYLPTGHYQLEATLDRAADSLPPTVVSLGSFDTVWRGLAASDLGTVFLQGSSQVATGPVEIAPGGAITRQFSIIQDRQYQVAVSSPDIDVELFRVTSSGTAPVANPGVANPSGGDDDLAPGVYELVATNRATSARSFALAIHPVQTSDESLSLGGVGQLPAIAGNMTLLTGSAPTSTVALGGPAAPGPSDSTPSERTSTMAPPSPSVPVEARGSFSLQALDLAPVGSLSSPSAAASFPPPTIPATLGIAVNSSLVVIPGNAPSSPPTGSRRLASSSLQEPSTAPGIEIDARPSESAAATPPTAIVPAPGCPDPVEVVTIEPTAGTTESASGDEWREAVVSTGLPFRHGLLSLMILEPEAEPLTEPVNLASLASPAGLVLAGCVLYRQIKVARSHPAPTPWRRPWDRPDRADRSRDPNPNRLRAAR